MIDCWRRTQSPASAATASRTTAAAQATDSAHAGARSARDQHAASNADGCSADGGTDSVGASKVRLALHDLGRQLRTEPSQRQDGQSEQQHIEHAAIVE